MVHWVSEVATDWTATTEFLIPDIVRVEPKWKGRFGSTVEIAVASVSIAVWRVASESASQSLPVMRVVVVVALVVVSGCQVMEEPMIDWVC